jgi:hypothetical protein
MHPGERRERSALEAQLHMLDRCASCVSSGTEVLQCMEAGRRLPQHQGNQRQPGDQRFARYEQVRYLDSSSIFLQRPADRQLRRGTLGPSITMRH